MIVYYYSVLIFTIYESNAVVIFMPMVLQIKYVSCVSKINILFCESLALKINAFHKITKTVYLKKIGKTYKNQHFYNVKQIFAMNSLSTPKNNNTRNYSY